MDLTDKSVLTAIASIAGAVGITVQAILSHNGRKKIMRRQQGNDELTASARDEIKDAVKTNTVQISQQRVDFVAHVDGDMRERETTNRRLEKLDDGQSRVEVMVAEIRGLLRLDPHGKKE